MKNSRKINSKPGRKKTKFGYRLSLLFRLLLTAFFLLAAYALWLDFRIHKEFEGSKWTLPARVYSRPVDIYLGQKISPAYLEHILQSRNYLLSEGLSGPGRYTPSPAGLTVYLRSFDYWDGHDPANLYQIESQNGAISRILDMKTNTDVTLIRIEPTLIGKIYPDHNEDRLLIELEEVPTFLINALISVEDRDFYYHSGIDFKAILRAFWVNFRNIRLSQGGSTLTQQLVKNFFLTRERTFSRKLNEIIMAVLLELRYQKSEILTAYINEVYLGQDGARAIHGFANAAEFYFNKPLAELRRDQLALLAGMVRGASYYNPRRSPARARARRDLVLTLMTEQGHLDHKELKLLTGQELDVTSGGGRPDSDFHAFLDIARRQLLRDYDIDDLKNEGLKIYTTLDILQQQNLYKVVSKRLNRLELDRGMEAGILESASLVVNPANAEVLAISGSRNMITSGFNRALDARRPIGSLIKPFIYLTALSRPEKYSLLSVLDDTRFKLELNDGTRWSPDNYDRTEHGEVSLFEALVNSYNLATVRLGMDAGLENVIANLHEAGIQGSVDAYPSLLLGALDLSPFEVAQIYQALANGGYMSPLNSILEVLDDNGEPLQRRNLTINQSLDEQAVFLVNFLMSKVVEMGTARQLSAYMGDRILLAGKTGTSDEYRDSWFAGFSDDTLVVTWLGRDDNQPTTLTGASGAMLVWADIMNSTSYRPLQLLEPANISWLEDQSLRFADRCLPVGRIPYTGGKPPDNVLGCSDVREETKSIFSIRSWFQ